MYIGRRRRMTCLHHTHERFRGSSMICLESLFDHVAPKGLIVLDDYYAWDGCSRALHDFLSRRTAVERIRNHGEICVVEKRGVTPPK
jgi:hypothetical protein